MNDINKNPTDQELHNDRSVKKSLLVRASLFLLFAAGVVCLSLGTIKYLNSSGDGSVLNRLPKLHDTSDKNQLLTQELTKAGNDLRQTFLSNQPNQSFGQKAGQLGEIYHGNDFYSEALACYEIAMEFDHENPRWPHHTAFLRQMRGETVSVIRLLERTIKLSNGYPPAVLKLADTYYKMGELDQAEIYYQKFLNLNPGDKFALLGLGRIAMDSSKWQQAQEYLEKAIESKPKVEAAYQLLALVHRHFGRTELMNSILEQAAKPPRVKYPIPPDPWIDEVDLLCYDPSKILGLGDKAIKMHNVELGLKFFHRALMLEVDDPRYSDLYLKFAKRLTGGGNIKLAQDFLKKAIQIDPDNDEAYRQRGTYLINEFEPHKAEQKLLKALQIDPENARTNYFLGMCAFLQADFPKAIKLFTTALKFDPELDADDPGLSMGRELILSPNDPQHYITTGNKLFASGHRKVSKKFFEKIIQLDPGHSEAYAKLGLILISENKTQQAEQMFLKALESDSENIPARLRLAQILLEKNQFQSALKQYRLILQRNPDSVKALNALAWIIATAENPKSRDPAEAVKSAKRACELTNYKRPMIIDTLAVAYAADGQFQQAINTSQKALELANSVNNKKLAESIKKRLELYKLGKPYIEPKI